MDVDRFTYERALRGLPKGLSTTSRLAAFIIASYADSVTGQAYPGYETIAQGLGRSLIVAKRSVKILVASGWLRLERKGGRHGKVGVSNRYQLCVPQSITGDTLDDSQSIISVPQSIISGPQSIASDTVTISSKNNQFYNKRASARGKPGTSKPRASTWSSGSAASAAIADLAAYTLAQDEEVAAHGIIGKVRF